MDTAELIRFPRERVRATWSILGEDRDPCLILILPVVRIERDLPPLSMMDWENDPPLLGRRQTRRCRRAIDKLRDPKR